MTLEEALAMRGAHAIDEPPANIRCLDYETGDRYLASLAAR